MNKFLKVLLISSVTFNLFSGPNEDILKAAESGNLAAVKDALDAAADIETAKTNESSALMVAAYYGHTVTVRLLLDRGADVNHADNRGSAALIFAAENGHTDTVGLLLDRGADINHINNYGKTPLISAAQHGHTNTVKLLLNRDAHIDRVDREGDTALDLARQLHRTEIVSILEQTPKIKQLVDNAIKGDENAYQKLIEKIKDLNIDSYEFKLILNNLISKIKSDGINKFSRKLLLDLAYHIAINLGSAVVGLLPEDILAPILKSFLPDIDLDYEFDMMRLDEYNQPIK